MPCDGEPCEGTIVTQRQCRRINDVSGIAAFSVTERRCRNISGDAAETGSVGSPPEFAIAHEPATLGVVVLVDCMAAKSYDVDEQASRLTASDNSEQMDVYISFQN